jgi:hypothetical protein
MAPAALAAQEGQLCSGEEQHVEFTLVSLNFLGALMHTNSEAAVKMLLGYYPSIIFRELLTSNIPIVVSATCSLLSRLANGDPDAQRYCRLEEVLKMLVEALSKHAAALHADLDVSTLQVSVRCFHGRLEHRFLPIALH